VRRSNEVVDFSTRGVGAIERNQSLSGNFFRVVCVDFYKNACGWVP